MTASAAPRHAEDGSAPLELALGVGLLLLPVAVLVLSFPTWIERQAMARAAAGEAARAAVLAEHPDGAVAAAEALVAEAARNHGVDPADVTVCLSSAPVGAPPGACTDRPHLGRGAAVTAEVTVRLPALTLPGLATALEATSTTARHTERVDRYRSYP